MRSKEPNQNIYNIHICIHANGTTVDGKKERQKKQWKIPTVITIRHTFHRIHTQKSNNIINNYITFGTKLFNQIVWHGLLTIYLLYRMAGTA